MNNVRQLLNALGYASGDHDADVRAALEELLLFRHYKAEKPAEWKYRYILEGTLDVDVEDGGATLIGHLLRDSLDGDVFVRIHSYDERVWLHADHGNTLEVVEQARKRNPDIHRDFMALLGQRVRVKIEALK